MAFTVHWNSAGVPPINQYLFITVMSAMWADINHQLGFDTREHFIRSTTAETQYTTNSCTQTTPWYSTSRYAN